MRQMEREIGNICRKAAREIYEHDKKRVQVTERNIEKYLGKEKYTYQMANAEDEVGIVRGLAWTSVGGDTLQIEVNVMPGKGEIILTGQLGDVMKESAQAGISYIRSISSKYKVAEDFFENMISISIFRKGQFRKMDLQPALRWRLRCSLQLQTRKCVPILP